MAGIDLERVDLRVELKVKPNENQNANKRNLNSMQNKCNWKLIMWTGLEYKERVNGLFVKKQHTVTEKINEKVSQNLLEWFIHIKKL